VTVEVRFFASLAERAGATTLSLELEPGATPTTLWERLRELRPGLAAVSFRPLVACDLEYAEWDRDLAGVREVAFLPPVSGG